MDEGVLDANLDRGGLEITPMMRTYFAETAKWGKFIAIVGFVMMLIFIIIALFMAFFMGSILSEFEEAGEFGGAVGGLMGFIYLVIALIYFFPLFFLYRSSSRMKTALAEDDLRSLSESFKYQKSLYKFIGISLAIMLGLYAIGILMMVIGGGIGLLNI